HVTRRARRPGGGQQDRQGTNQRQNAKRRPGTDFVRTWHCRLPALFEPETASSRRVSLSLSTPFGYFSLPCYLATLGLAFRSGIRSAAGKGTHDTPKCLVGGGSCPDRRGVG